MPQTIDGTTGATVPAQPEVVGPMRKKAPIVLILVGIVLLIGLSNLVGLVSGNKGAPKSNLAAPPAVANPQQVGSFETQQAAQVRQDAENRDRQQKIAEQMAALQAEGAIPGPESPTAAPMTPAQRDAIYGNSPNAPQRTSTASQANAEAKQRALAREKLHQDALSSDTLAIDFAHTGPAPTAAATAAAPQKADVLAEREEETTQANGEDLASSSGAPGTGVPGQRSATLQPVSDQRGPSAKTNADPMARYGFDAYQGRLYHVFEGTVFEGVVTNHIDGAFAGPMIVMLTTDYYSHDHQQLLFPQGTRLIGNVRSVGSAQQRKLFVVFNRAVCPDGFSLDLNKYIGLDPLGTTGLATNVNNHYLSSFAAAALIGGIGGLAQIGNTGSVLTADAEIRNGISEQTAQESEQILNQFLNRLPVITVKEGSRARVYITQDMLIPSYAEHRVDPNL